MNEFLRSVIEQDTEPVVICDLQHIIIYMNPAAIQNYAKRGGAALIGANLLNCHNPNSNQIILQVVEWFTQSVDNNIVHTSYDEDKNKDIYMVALRNDKQELIGYYEKHESRNRDDEPFYNM